jgi:hypothetical protein
MLIRLTAIELPEPAGLYSLAGQGKYQEAGSLLAEDYTGPAERRTRMPALDRDYLPRSEEAIVSLLYRAWPQPGKAEEWRRKLATEVKSAPIPK